MNLDQMEHKFETCAAALKQWDIVLTSSCSGLLLTGPNNFIAHFSDYREINAFILGLEFLRDSR
jgi:hypothetical protein